MKHLAIDGTLEDGIILLEQIDIHANVLRYTLKSTCTSIQLSVYASSSFAGGGLILGCSSASLIFPSPSYTISLIFTHRK